MAANPYWYPLEVNNAFSSNSSTHPGHRPGVKRRPVGRGPGFSYSPVPGGRREHPQPISHHPGAGRRPRHRHQRPDLRHQPARLAESLPLQRLHLPVPFCQLGHHHGAHAGRQLEQLLRLEFLRKLGALPLDLGDRPADRLHQLPGCRRFPGHVDGEPKRHGQRSRRPGGLLQRLGERPDRDRCGPAWQGLG